MKKKEKIQTYQRTNVKNEKDVKRDILIKNATLVAIAYVMIVRGFIGLYWFSHCN